MKTIAFTTLGCKVNLYDTEAMSELFEEKGYKIVDFDDIADIYVINTCTVTNFGDKKSRQMIRRAKRQNKNAVVVAAGCYAQTAPKAVEAVDGINIVLGTKDRRKAVEIIENYIEKGNTDTVLNMVSDIMEEKVFEPLKITKLSSRTRAYVKIQDGCNRYCTYCMIPFARGPVRSRKPDDVTDEIKRLAANEFKEVVLTGIHVASYGMDLGNISLADIIERVHEVDGIERIRFSSMEPNAVTDDFVSRMKALPKVCDHYHLSLQSGCDNTLKRMNRRYTAQEYAAAVDRLRSVYKDAAVTTDIIVGFPGETESDFEESCRFAQQMQLAKIHVFPYSPKTGTAAAKMKNQIDSAVKSDRSARMIEVSSRLNQDFLTKFKGRIMPVLFETRIENGMYEGHTTNYIKVLVNTDDELKNKIINVRLDDIYADETMTGTLIL